MPGPESATITRTSVRSPTSAPIVHLAGGVLEGVAEEVHQDPVQPVRIDLNGGEARVHQVLPPAGSGAPCSTSRSCSTKARSSTLSRLAVAHHLQLRRVRVNRAASSPCAARRIGWRTPAAFLGGPTATRPIRSACRSTTCRGLRRSSRRPAGSPRAAPASARAFGWSPQARPPRGRAGPPAPGTGGAAPSRTAHRTRTRRRAPDRGDRPC